MFLSPLQLKNNEGMGEGRWGTSIGIEFSKKIIRGSIPLWCRIDLAHSALSFALAYSRIIRKERWTEPLTLVPTGDHKVTNPLFHTSELHSKVPLSYHNRANCSSTHRRLQPCTVHARVAAHSKTRPQGASCIVTQVLPPSHNSFDGLNSWKVKIENWKC